MIVLVLLSLIPVFFAIVKYWQIAWHHFSFGPGDGTFSARALRTETKDDNTTVVLKSAYTGDKKLIVKDITIKSRLTYLSGNERVFAWLKLAIGYFTDDMIGLQTVFGHVLPSTTWIIGGPVYRIKNRYIRKPLSILLGIITTYFFMVYLIPVFWPLLWLGPYLEFQQIARDETITLRKGTLKLTRPFILDSATEEELQLDYHPSSMVPSLGNGSPLPKVKINEVKELPELEPTRLPQTTQFLWRTEVSLYITVNLDNLDWYVYRIGLGTGVVNLVL